MFQRVGILGPLSLAVIVLGCRPASPTPSNPQGTEQKPSTAETVPSVELREKEPRQIAIATKDEMLKRLSMRLLEAMGNGGPVAAIPVCQKEAPRIAEKIGTEFGVSVGRTSKKLRNPENIPPAWVNTVIEQEPKEPAFVDLPEHHTGAVFPIFLKVQCLTCHGPRNQIPNDVQAKLAELYPQDQAVDFQEGDLRGWLWVDVPAPVARPE